MEWKVELPKVTLRFAKIGTRKVCAQQVLYHYICPFDSDLLQSIFHLRRKIRQNLSNSFLGSRIPPLQHSRFKYHLLYKK